MNKSLSGLFNRHKMQRTENCMVDLVPSFRESHRGKVAPSSDLIPKSVTGSAEGAPDLIDEV